jgi:D-alanyl-D-alanine dipeptidase
MASPYEQPQQPSELPNIPEVRPLAGWKEVPLVETDLSHESLVPVGIFSDYRHIVSSSVYADEHHNSPYTGGLEGSNIAVFMREGVAKRLVIAAKMLPSGHHIMVMDAYRTLDIQGTLYKQYEDGLKALHPDWTAEELSTETQKYVSVPSHDKKRPSPHNTGASVDVVIVKVDEDVQQEIDTIDATLEGVLGKDDWQREYMLEMRRSELIRRYGKMLNFGTRFDYGGSEAALRYYEEKAEKGALSPEDEEPQKNRRLLYDVMIKAGFEPYADEWWHYNDPASQMGAKVAGREYAEYGAVEMSEENKQYEQMRKQHHVNSVRLARGEEWTPPEGLELHYALARAAILGNGPKNVWSMTNTVARIEPPKEDIAA